jgi:hypothetical protein
MSEPFDDCMNKARVAAAQCVWPAAEHWYSDAVCQQPASVSAHRVLGIVLTSQQKFDEVETALRGALN